MGLFKDFLKSLGMSPVKRKPRTAKSTPRHNTRPIRPTRVYITGPNTDGREFVEQNKSIEYGDGLEIGASPDCWITLPDPTLEPVVAKIMHLSHHKMLVVLKPGGESNFDDLRNTNTYRIDNRLLNHMIGGYLVEEERI